MSKRILVPISSAITVMLSLVAGMASAADLQKPVMSLAEAKQAMRAAVKYAHDNDAPGGAIAIVDDGGHIVLIERLDGTFPASSGVATGKAQTAAMFRRATRGFETLINEGRTTMVSLPAVTSFTPLQGGVPLIKDGVVVGAIGVSGAASAQQDDKIAQAAADAFTSGEQAEVRYWPNEDVKKAFAKGQAIIETGDYKVHASRRDGPGEAEVHLTDTDIFYILDGNARFVTGGELVEPRITGDNELRANSIKGGKAQELNAGDLVVIPKGVPHWFESVSGPFTYYVVKSVN